MRELLSRFENKTPEVVFEWNDPETSARGWVVINSLRGGAAGGGTRMRVGLDKREVESLAKTMEVKFTVSGPAIGGAKSGIDFDPNDLRKKGVLERWYAAVAPLLRSYYGTGGDLNVDEVHEVIPITEDCGVWHPQEGVFTGHFKPTQAQKIRRIGALRLGVKKVIENPKYSPDIDRKYVVADMVTGYGVAESVKHYYDIYGGDVSGKRVVVQGWGNVGSAAAYYLSAMGARIVGIIDRAGGIIAEEGISHEQIIKLFLDKDGNKLHSEDMLSFEETNERIWDLETEVFLPCAASRLISREQAERMVKTGLEVVSCGANVPFADPEIFYGEIAEFVDTQVSLIPDFISNCGMARVFAYLMQPDAEIEDQAIFSDTSEIIKTALASCHAQHSDRTKLTHTAFEIALQKLT